MVAKAELNVRQRSKRQENSPGPDAKNRKPQEVSREGIQAGIVSQALTVGTTVSHQSKMQPAQSPKSLVDVPEPTVSTPEHLATEVICGGNVVSLSMAN